MKDKMISVSICDEMQLRQVDESKVQFCFLGEDGSWFRLYAFSGGEIVSYDVTVDVPKEKADEFRKKLLSSGSWRSHYLGLGHTVSMRQRFYLVFSLRMLKAAHPYPTAHKTAKELLQFGFDKDRLRDIVKGVVYGHAVGDAVGVPAEFFSREALKKDPLTEELRAHPTLDLPKGCWSDDTSMALCTLDSLAKGKIDYDGVMDNFVRWYDDGAFTPTGYTFDVGLICAKAIERYKDGTPATVCGGVDEYDNGNGSLMRIYPFVLYLYDKEMSLQEKLDVIHKASALTHAHRRSQIACGLFACMLWGVMSDSSKEGALGGLVEALDVYRGEEELNHILPSLDSCWEKEEKDVPSSGYVVDTLEAALWCFLGTNDFKSCILAAVNLGDDADTAAAVAGALAGALYGYDAIPLAWKDGLVNRKLVDDICDAFMETVVGKDCLGVDDVTAIKQVKLHRNTPSCSHAWYELTLTIGGKDCYAIYSSNSTNYLQKKGGERIPLSKEVEERLRSLTGESDDQRATRTLLGLDGFSYGRFDWTAPLSSEQVEKRFRDFSKVSFEAFKSLPEHWLVLMPSSAMYDWLHCSGYSGEESACAFVEELAKRSKIAPPRF